MRTLRLALLLTAIFAVLAATGCRPRRYVVRGGGEVSGNGQTDQRTTGVEVGQGVVAHGTPREQLDQYDQVLRQAGYEPVGPATRGVLSTEQAIAAFPIDVRRGYCYALTVFGSAGTDVNMFVLDPLGRDASHNVLPDEHPWASFCAARGGRFVIRVQLARGEGEFFFAPYHARGRRPVNLSAFFGTQSTAAQVATIDADTRNRLGVLDQTLGGERYVRVGEPSGVVLGERQERAFQLSLQRSQCYAFATLGGPGTTDTDLQLVDGTGRTLQVDEGTGRDALVRFCATDTAQYRLQVRLPAGSGPVFTIAYAQTPQGGQAVQTDPQGEQVGTDPVLTESVGGGLAENFALLDADMRARGYETLGQSQSGQLGQGAQQDFPVELEDDKCYALLAVGDGGVRGMTLSLVDPGGQVVDLDDTGGSRPTVRACTSRAGRYSLRISMANGQGNYMLGAYRWPRGTRGPFGLEGLTYVRFSEMTALLETEGFQFDTNYEPQQGRLRREGQEGTHTIELTGGQCYSILVAGGAGVRDLDATLTRDGREVESDTTTRGAFLALRHCVGQTQRFTLTIRATSGSGPYVSQIFTRAGAAE
ncbi:MAG: hypothetical protein J0L92_27150 [Deltaproteobacteria bacterium]|nr:hypothetical protein [Deltaproteobacteria bacterium]